MSAERAIALRRAANLKGEYPCGNPSPAMTKLLANLEAAHNAIDSRVRAEYPLETIVTIENPHRANRDFTGPVVGYLSSRWDHGGIQVRNQKTGVVRKVSINDWIFKESAS